MITHAGTPNDAEPIAIAWGWHWYWHVEPTAGTAMAVSEEVVTQASVPLVVRRNTLLLGAMQCISWVGIQAAATLNAIAAFELTGDKPWAGLPVTAAIAGTAIAAPYAGRLMDRLGRRPVLLTGQVMDMLGCLTAGLFILYDSFGGLVASMFIRGAGTGITSLSRLAAADMYPTAVRARGMSAVVTGGAIGAIAGPGLLNVVALWATGTGANTLALSWLALSALSLVGVVALALIRPDPRHIAANLASYYPDAMWASGTVSGVSAQGTDGGFVAAPVSRRYTLTAAVIAIALIQAGMIMVMVTAPLSMKLHGHEDAVYGVMTGHFAGMLGLSLFIGRLADRVGRRPVLASGALIFITGAATDPLFQNPLINGISLFLVGLGWCFCYVAANAIIADTTRPTERGRITGINDLLVSVCGAVASVMGGVLLSGAGYMTVGAAGIAVGLLPLLAALRLREGRPGHYVH